MDSAQLAGFSVPVISSGLLTFLASAVTSLLLTPVAMRIGHRRGIVDWPGPRKVHRAPIPRIGGLALFAGFVAGISVAVVSTGYWHHLPVRTGYWGAMTVAATGMLILGLVDDVIGVSFRHKFSIQILASLVVWAAGFRVSILSFPFGGDPIELGWMSLPVTVLWVVGITNAINLIDGLDGLAAGCALITTTAVAAIAMHGDRVAVTAISVALVGSLVGFLRYNFNPARIFLGDSGSMFLGFVLAVISIHGSQKGPAAVAALAPILVLGVPILDTTLAVTRRLYRLGRESKRPGRGASWAARNLHTMFLPDREHLHHQMLDLGMGQRAAVLVLYAFMVAFALLALAVVVLNSVRVALVLLFVLTIALAILLFVLVRARRHRARRPEERLCGGSLETPPSPVGQI